MNVLVVDTNQAAALSIKSSLEERFTRVDTATGASDTKRMVDDGYVNLVLLDWYLPESESAELCQWIRSNYVNRYIYIICVIDHSDSDGLLDALMAGADEVISNPVDPDELELRFRSAIRLLGFHSQLQRKNQRLVASFDHLMKDFMEVTTDLADAGRVQKCLLPATQQFNRVNAHGILRPATQLSGDSFDFFQLSDDYLAFYIADAVGHGSASAMVSYALHHQIKPRAQGICSTNLANSTSIEEAVVNTVADLNEQFISDEGEDNRWFTMIYGLIGLSSGKVVLSQAGQPPALHASYRDDEIQEIGSGGFPVGLFEEASYTTNTCVLKPGDKLLLCSDGAVECKSIDEEEFGVESLKQSMQDFKDLGLEDTAIAITERLVDWNGGETFTDDLSLLLFQFAA